MHVLISELFAKHMRTDHFTKVVHLKTPGRCAPNAYVFLGVKTMKT